jgi:hypothetical protein
MFGFAPALLAREQVAPALAGLAVAAATWLVVVSAHGGGVLAQRGGRDGALMAAGTLGWAACLAVLALASGLEAPALLAAGLLMGLPVGVVMSLPARVLRPENRAVGMGLFYVWLYVGHGGLPPLAGLVGDLAGGPAAPLLLAAALVAAMLPIFLLFRHLAALR